MTRFAPIAYVRCTRPTLVPLPAPVDALLGVWPRHPQHTIVRLDGRRRIVTAIWLPTDVTFDLVRHCMADGTLIPLTAACAQALLRPRREAWPSASLLEIPP